MPNTLDGGRLILGGFLVEGTVPSPTLNSEGRRGRRGILKIQSIRTMATTDGIVHELEQKTSSRRTRIENRWLVAGRYGGPRLKTASEFQ